MTSWGIYTVSQHHNDVKLPVIRQLIWLQVLHHDRGHVYSIDRGHVYSINACAHMT